MYGDRESLLASAPCGAGRPGSGAAHVVARHVHGAVVADGRAVVAADRRLGAGQVAGTGRLVATDADLGAGGERTTGHGTLLVGVGDHDSGMRSRSG